MKFGKGVVKASLRAYNTDSLPSVKGRGGLDRTIREELREINNTASSCRRQVGR